MKDQRLIPEKAGRELLSNCFAAVRPDAEWFGYFREGMEKLVGPLEEFASDSNNSLALQAARRIAHEESFGSASLVRELNLSEILSRAKSEADQLIAEKTTAVEIAQRQLDTERALAAKKMEEQQTLHRELTDKERRIAQQQVAAERERAAQDKEAAAKSATEEARRQLAAQLEESNRRRAHRWADRLILSIRVTAIAVFVLSSLALWLTKGEAHTAIWLVPLTLFFGSSPFWSSYISLG